MLRTMIFAVSILAILAGSAWATVGDFDDLSLGADGYWNGGPVPGNHSFASGSVTFNNAFFYDAYYNMTSWAGWAYSNKSDTTTLDWTNQYSAITGAAQSGANYAVGYMDTWNGVNPTVMLATPSVVDSAWFTNTTYSYYSIHGGTPPYGKKFGDAPNPDDWFLLTITGKNATGSITGPVKFYLADFRFANNANDYIVKDWTRVDLTSLGAVKSLEFTLTSSDTSFSMLNNPAYFAMDTLTLSPEPATLGLLAAGLAAIARRRRT